MKIKVHLLQENPGLPGLEGIMAGEEVEVEEWTARTLIKKRMAEIVEPLTFVELRRMVLAEERERGLRELPPDFLVRLSLALEQAGELRNQMVEAVEELLETRIQKILSNLPYKSENMLPEEVALLNLLSVEVERWKEEMKRRLGI
jgi:Na+/phosphate symporter